MIDGFDRVAFGREFSPKDSPFLVKYDEPIRILLVHAEGDREPLLRVRKVIRRIKSFHRHPEFRAIDTLSIKAYAPDRDGIGHLDECFAEEMLQSMGLPDDSDNLIWSMFNDNNDAKWPGDFDNLLMSILYSPELTAGMQREDVRERVPQIVDELWADHLAERRRRGAGRAGS